MTRELSPVSSTRCSFRRASGLGLLAYTVLRVWSCCSESTVLTRGPLSATLPLFLGPVDTASGPGHRLLALLDSGKKSGRGGEEREGTQTESH